MAEKITIPISLRGEIASRADRVGDLELGREKPTAFTS